MDNAMILCAKCHAELMHPDNAQLREMAKRQMQMAKVPTKEQGAWRIWRRMEQ